MDEEMLISLAAKEKVPIGTMEKECSYQYFSFHNFQRSIRLS
jgi:hypothetical protein